MCSISISQKKFPENLRCNANEADVRTALLEEGGGGSASPHRAAQNLKIFDLILASKFEVFRGLSSKNLDISNLNYVQNLILNLKSAVLILISNFEVFFEDP